MPTSAQAEVPFATMIPAHPRRYHPRTPDQIKRGVYSLIIIHITSGHGDAHGTAAMWQQEPELPPPHEGTSAHFVVGQDGFVIQAVPLRFAANHSHDANNRAIGIEHAAREPNEPSFPKGDPGLPPSDVQLQQSARLVSYLLKAAGLKPVRGVTIMGHAEADPKTTHSLCPDGAPWDWAKYMALVQDEFAKIDGDDEPPAAA